MNKFARLPAEHSSRRKTAEAARPARRSRYFAFLSYSHKDAELADWLHSELEEFRVPSAIAGRLTENGVAPRRLSPIFRDQHELAAATDLGEEIETALASSQFLIVLCSPDGAKSRWVNAEIELFKRSRPDGCVLAAIASGEPFASETSGREAEECFPRALRRKHDRRGRPTGRPVEPLAADFRDADGRRLALLRLVAGMLGVQLDELVQRHATRRHRRLAWLAAASFAGMAVASSLAVTAVRSRNEAREQRREAEGLVAFMLGDLKDKLEPIGRLDALDGVGKRILAYYSKQDTGQLSDAGLVQRSQALSLMGQVADLRGNMDGAVRFYREAMAGTAEAISRDPNNPQRLYDHAQNVFWVGSLDHQLGNMSGAEAAMRQYKDLAQRMVALDPDNMKWRMEEQDADTNLGFVFYQQRRFADAEEQFSQSVQMVRALATTNPSNGDYQKALAESMAWLGDAQRANGDFEAAMRVRQDQIALLSRAAQQPNSDVEYREMLIPAEESLGWLYAMRGQRDLAFQQFRASLEAAQRLIPTEPNNTLWQGYAMSTRFSFAENLLQNREIGEASENAEAGCAIDQGLMARNGHYQGWRAGARQCWILRAEIALATNRKNEALTFANNAIRSAAIVSSSDRVADKYGLSKAYLVLGDVERSLGEPAAAATAWQRAVHELPAGVAEQPVELDHHARILERVGDSVEAQRIAARLNAMGYRRAD